MQEVSSWWTLQESGAKTCRLLNQVKSDTETDLTKTGLM